MTTCTMCQKQAEKRFTWVNDTGAGKGAGLQGGPMCDHCMEFMWDALSRFPTAEETVTIWPLKEAAP